MTSNKAKAQDFFADSLLTSYQVGELLQVNPSSVNKWVKDGRIAAFRTPGGHRRIKAGDLVAFLTLHKMPIPSALQTASRRRLLLADDDSLHLNALKQALEGYADRLDVQVASNGVDALVQVGSFHPHIVAISQKMSGIDGLEICRRLHAGLETRNIEVVLLSANMSSDIERQASAAGAKKVLQKPAPIEALVAELGMLQLHIAP